MYIYIFYGPIQFQTLGVEEKQWGMLYYQTQKARAACKANKKLVTPTAKIIGNRQKCARGCLQKKPKIKTRIEKGEPHKRCSRRCFWWHFCTAANNMKIYTTSLSYFYKRYKSHLATVTLGWVMVMVAEGEEEAGEGNANIAARHAILKLVYFYCHRPTLFSLPEFYEPHFCLAVGLSSSLLMALLLGNGSRRNLVENANFRETQLNPAYRVPSQDNCHCQLFGCFVPRGSLQKTLE